jgi:hypothetical protein
LGRITKIRAEQTRADEKYDPSGHSLATDSEVESRIRKHSALFHHGRDDNSKMTFDADGKLTDIRVWDETDTLLLQHSEFTYDLSGNLTTLVKTVWEEDGAEYTKLQKDFLTVNGILTEIQNRIIT